MASEPTSKTERETRRRLASADFKAFFERELKPLEAEFERRRGPRRRERNLRMAAALTAWLSLAGLGIWWLDGGVDFGWWMLAFALLFTGVLLGVWAWLPIILQYGEIKTDVLPRMLPFFGDLRITWDATLPLGPYQGFGIIPRHNKVYVEDLLEGSHRGVPLRVAEISLKYTYRSGRSERVEEVFRGLLVDLQLGAESDGLTITGTEGMFTRRFALPEDAGLQPSRGGEGFESHATPGARPAVPLNARLLRQLTEIEILFDAKRLALSQKDDRLLLLIDKEQDFFEIPAAKRADFRHAAEVMGEQVQRIFAVIDLLEVSGPQQPPEPVDSRPPPVSASPTRASERQAYGGWGCLTVFVLWIAAIVAYGYLLGGHLRGDHLVVWSTLGGLLGATGLFMALRGLRKRSIGGLLFAALLLGGAYWMLAYFRGG